MTTYTSSIKSHMVFQPQTIMHEVLNSSASSMSMHESLEGIFKSMPNLNLKTSSSGSSIFSDKADSGFESPFKTSRWAKMNFNLLHRDLNKFLKKNSPSNNVDKTNTFGVRSSMKKRDSWCNSIVMCDDEEATLQLKQLTSSSLIPNVVKESLLNLCQTIADHLLQSDSIERVIFGRSEDNFTTMDKTTAIVHWDTSKTLVVKAQEIINALYCDLNVARIQQLFNVMERFCFDRRIPIYHLKLSFDVFQQLVHLLRSCAINYIDRATDENSNNLNEAARRLSVFINDMSSRMWTVANLIEVP